MNRQITTLALLATLAMPGAARAAEFFTPFSKGDLALEAAWQVAHVIDWGQTRDIAKNPDRYHERNPILGRHPSTGQVDMYMAGSAVGHALLAWMLPGKWRTGFQVLSLGCTVACVINNNSIGLQVNF